MQRATIADPLNFPSDGPVSLRNAVAHFTPGKFHERRAVMPRSDVEEYLLSLLAADAIESNPELCFSLLEHAQGNAVSCSSRRQLLQILQNEDPIVELCRSLRAHPDESQLLRSCFPFYLVIPVQNPAYRAAVTLAGALTAKGWVDTESLFPPHASPE